MMASGVSNNIFITGATGFLGKVVVEELLRLRQKRAIGQILLLLRKKDLLDAVARFEQHVAASPCFASLPQGWERSILVVEGDLAQPHCGLKPNEYEKVCKITTHIIHTAACIKFDSTVPEAITSNVDSALHVLALAKDCHNLRQLVITSTAYVTPPQLGPIYEDLVELPCPANKLISELRSGILGKREAIAATGHPNIYSLSKCLAEHVICETRGSLPVTIVRPSIICAAIRHPVPGWIDSRAAFGGLVLGFGTGSLRVIDGRPQAKLDIVPVDMVAESLINELFRQGTNSLKPEGTRIVFSVATLEKSVTLGEACKILERCFKERFRYIGPQSDILDLYDLVHHYLPFRLEAAVSRAEGDETGEAKANKKWKITRGMNSVFRPYTNFTHDFRPKDACIRFDPEEYMHIICQGVRQNLMDSKL
ncbi:fatty acyl reductase 6 chloroplastic [Fusarium beomiforme]|uniref:Fatty acyl-CoA reductase n=1 Tax=Fusarium beomiforme TaxID=44412 RepID=A0A9P5APA9_9HYPO|nr:fatty acyl reductase 6 chloroplastic [Fusarium beomiforme]